MTGTPQDAIAFARAWQAGWNSHDLDRIMAHYADDIVFTSRKAIAITGQGRLIGTAALRTYWAAALARQPDLRFEVQRVFSGHAQIVLHYTNHRSIHAAETLEFGADGLVVRASASHAAQV